MKQLHLIHNKRGQATAELAIMGSIVIMLLAYLLQQGYLYNSRQSLEMYTFREALRQSRSQERGVTLTVIRDIIIPSFFSSLNRQRLMSSASIDLNPWKLYIPDVAQDLPTRQLLQVDEAMIRNRLFFEVPPTHIKLVTEANQDQSEEDQWQWVNSAIREIDPQTPLTTPRTSTYNYTTQVSETDQNKTITKNLSSDDRVSTGVTFEEKETIEQNYIEDDWTQPGDDEHITSVEVRRETIPRGITLRLDELVRRAKRTTTPH